METTRVFLGVGSNVGERADHIKHAYDALGGFLEHERQASLYETRPREVIDQPLFLNTVVSGLCSLSPAELLEKVAWIERDLGRDRSNERRKGPRTVDIDILLYGEHCIDGDDLVIPHPRMTERKFVLIPLLELDPELRDPVTGLPFQHYLDSLEPQGIYYFTAKRYSRGTSGQ